MKKKLILKKIPVEDLSVVHEGTPRPKKGETKWQWIKRALIGI